MCFNTIVQRDNELILFNPHVVFGKLFYDHRNPGYKTRKQIECKKFNFNNPPFVVFEIF